MCAPSQSRIQNENPRETGGFRFLTLPGFTKPYSHLVQSSAQQLGQGMLQRALASELLEWTQCHHWSAPKVQQQIGDSQQKLPPPADCAGQMPLGMPVQTVPFAQKSTPPLQPTSPGHATTPLGW